MRRGLVGLFCSFVALAQPQRDPFQLTYSAYHEARQAGRFDVASAKREELRRMAETAPVDSPQFGSWVRLATQVYESAGMHARARAITEQALDRTAGLGEWSPVRIQLLNQLASSWQQDRNLLKAVQYLEQAAAAAEKAPHPSAAKAGFAPLVRVGAPDIRMTTGPAASIYQRLVSLYRQLGRPNSVNDVLAKLRALGPESESALAGVYQNEGRWEEAALVYKNQAERVATDPMKSAMPLQNLANVYQQQERYGEAASAMQQAISGFEAAGMRDQASATRRQLARTLAQAGQIEAADQVYQQLLANENSRDWSASLTAYANYLADTKRAAQAENLLTGYLENHSELAPYQQSTFYFTLGSIARKAGDNDRSDEYVGIALEKQRANQKEPAPEQNTTQKYVDLAQKALARDDEAAFGFALQALEAASVAGAEREQVVWAIPMIASQLAARKSPEKAGQIYERLLAMVQSWSADTMEPAVQVAQNYAQFLLAQSNRRGEAADAIERYRTLLIAARGEGTGWQEEVFRMTINLERTRGATARAVIAGQDLVALEESLNGPASEPYLRALEMLAGLYQFARDTERELALRQQAIGISDLVSTGNDTRRVQTRIDAALALAQAQRFDEAESLTAEALVIAKGMHPPRVDQFRHRAEQILKMRKP